MLYISLLLIVFLAGRFRALFEAAFRRQLFQLRHELFMAFADEGVSFDNFAHRDRRHELEAMARFAHRASLGQIAPVVLLNRWMVRRGEASIYSTSRANRAVATAQLSPSLAAKLAEIDRKTQQLILGFMLVAAPSGWFLVLLALTFVVVALPFAWILKRIDFFKGEAAAFTARVVRQVVGVAETDQLARQRVA